MSEWDSIRFKLLSHKEIGLNLRHESNNLKGISLTPHSNMKSANWNSIRVFDNNIQIKANSDCKVHNNLNMYSYP